MSPLHPSLQVVASEENYVLGKDGIRKAQPYHQVPGIGIEHSPVAIFAARLRDLPGSTAEFRFK